jgi:predicted XRE-type DNA-binding protein
MATSNPKPAQLLKQQLLKAVQGRIEKVRARDGLTQAQAAEMLGMTQPRLSALVQGHLELFSLEALIDIAAKLGLTVRLNIARPYKAG